ncbi:ATP-dependent RNA helicase vasa [Aphelenchoides bicaudatus]|nr:ATP-dependent RNA helicase vasa [Aphelenchoides bicaudatus]
MDILDQDDLSLFDVVDKKREQKKRNNWQRLRGKLRKYGFADEEFAREYMIMMNETEFEEIAIEQLQNSSIKTSHNNFERLPLMNSFDEELDLDRSTWAILEHYRIRKPMPTQRITIPYITQTDADLITYTFLLPIISKIRELKREVFDTAPNKDSPYAIIVAPTHELTKQIARYASALVNNVQNINVRFAIGQQHGLDFQKNCRNGGCDILVLSPGKLFEYFLRRVCTKCGQCRPTQECTDHNRDGDYLPSSFFKIDNLRFVVLDEADKLMDDRPNKDQKPDGPGSFRSTMHEFIVDYLTDHKQHTDFRLLAFGATIEDNSYLNNLVNVGKKQPVKSVVQSFMQIDAEFNRKERLEELVDYFVLCYGPQPQNYEFDEEVPKRRIKKTIIFVNDKRTSDGLAHLLISKGISAKSLNADRSAQQREDALQEIMLGHIDVLVTTIMSRGVNIPNLEMVINYDFPKNMDEYQHRISRTGRIGNKGSSISFFNPKTDFMHARDLQEGCVNNGQEPSKVLQDCIAHYYRTNDGNMYNQHDYTLRQQQRYPPYNKRRSSVTDDAYSSSDNSSFSRQSSPRQRTK